MRVRSLSMAALGAATLLLATLPVGSPANASPSAPAALSLSASTHAAASTSAVTAKAGKCGTKFGTPIAPSGDGIIDVDGSGFNVAGAADVTCAKKTRIKKVKIMGYFGDPSSTSFHVTFYNNSASNEPDNANPARCATQTVTGSPTGSSYPTADTTTIKLAKKCKLKKGTSWVEVQAAPTSGAVYYWATQQEVGGSYPADWRDATGAFGTACTPGYLDGVYMQTCIFGGDIGENDFMLLLR